MGWKRSDLTPEIIAGMSPENQAKYGPGIHPDYETDPHPPPKTDVLERDEQRSFASWCMLNQLPVVWHSTAHRSKASLGCPDFVLGVKGTTLWIEFKRTDGKLSIVQEDFRDRLTAQGITLYVCYTAMEAIELCKTFM